MDPLNSTFSHQSFRDLANEYQKLAHATAVYGKGIVYPITALAEEAMEFLGECSLRKEQRSRGEGILEPTLMRSNLVKEAGDVYWNLAELCTRFGYRFGDMLDDAAQFYMKATAVQDTTSDEKLSYFISGVKDIQSIFTKWIRKHDGRVPTPKQMKDSIDKYTIQRVINQLTWYLGSEAVEELDIPIFYPTTADRILSVLNVNLKKLSERKRNNTLGGKGSVDRNPEE